MPISFFFEISMSGTRAKWSLDASNLPSVICPQPRGPIISLTFKCTWGSPIAEIQGLKLQDKSGKIVDTLISDKWYLNADLFPESISFPLAAPERPAFILIINGISSKGVKEMEIRYADQLIWSGEVQMGTVDNFQFSIGIPIEKNDFQKPNIHALRSAKAPFSMVGEAVCE